MPKILNSSEEIYAKERLRFSPLKIRAMDEKRESQYDQCTCGHSRANHNEKNKCTFACCYCDSFKRYS